MRDKGKICRSTALPVPVPAGATLLPLINVRSLSEPAPRKLNSVVPVFPLFTERWLVALALKLAEGNSIKKSPMFVLPESITSCAENTSTGPVVS